MQLKKRAHLQRNISKWATLCGS